MKIILNSIFVQDHDNALKFYTEKLGFVKKHDIPVGEFKWLTVVSPDDQNDTELLLEHNDNPSAKTYQKAIFEQDITATSFGVEDVEKEYQRLKSLGVKFTMERTQPGPVTIAVFDHTYGNLIQIAQNNQIKK